MNHSDAIFSGTLRDMNEAVFVVESKSGNLIYANGMCEKLLGISKTDAENGKSLRILINYRRK